MLSSVGDYLLVHALFGEYLLVHALIGDYLLVHALIGDYLLVHALIGDYLLVHALICDYLLVHALIGDCECMWLSRQPSLCKMSQINIWLKSDNDSYCFSLFSYLEQITQLK